MYIIDVTKQYSIAEARRHLPNLVDEAAAGAEVQLTRRGRPIAIVISVEEYERLKTGRLSFAEAYRDFRNAFAEGTDGIGQNYFQSLREREGGREVDL